MEEKKETTHVKPSLGVALIPIICLIILLSSAILLFGQDPHIPLVFATIIAVIVGNKMLGYSWAELEQAMIDTLMTAMQANLILMVIGILIGAWVLSGTVATMIYYGLEIIHPAVFLPLGCVMCCIVSLATGTSWGTAGTIGIALLGIGAGLGIPAPITAGCIISGAYFGDKMSPLSDTTNLAPAVAGSTLFNHIGHMVYTVTPSLIIALVLYGIIGAGYAGGSLDHAQIDGILTALQANYNINLLLLIPPALVILMVVFKIPALPGLIGGAMLGVVFYFIFQVPGKVSFIDGYGAILDVLNYGYVMESGNAVIDELLTRGGMQDMMWAISIVFCAMCFGGTMEKTGCLATISGALLTFAKGVGGLVTCTIFSCLFMNAACGDQYMAIVIPGKMYKEEFRKKGLDPRNLSRCLEDCATITSPLFPWNTCGAFMSATLGVNAFAYAPYAFLNLINPVISIIYGFTGITMMKLPEEELVKIRAEYGAAAQC